ncbi:MAG: methyltransferase domain-containing protein [Chloroflexota bacterium]
MMKHTTLNLLACPFCHERLEFSGPEAGVIQSGTLLCTRCSRTLPIVQGIPRFITPEELTGLNRRFARMYDWFSWVYAPFSKAAFAWIGMSEEQGRREILDRLDPQGGRVLEVSIGPGVNLPYLVRRTDVGGVYGLDISLGQLQRCQASTRRKGWNVDLFLGNGEQLPFQDETFDSVFHIGGINFFNDKRAVIEEMIRVAKRGTRILIADETEKGARGYERFLPGFKRLFEGQREAVTAPVDLVPAEMQERRLFEAWKGMMYCLEFRKP